MDARILFCIFIFFVFFTTANGKSGGLKLCVVRNPEPKSTRTAKYCDLLGRSKRTPVRCVFAADRLECLRAVSERTADFSIFEAEDLYFATLWGESSPLVVSEIRALKEKAFRYGIVAVVRKDGNVTGIEGLRGKRLCHPGAESGRDWNNLFAQYFEERVAPANCEDGLSMYEDRIKTSSNFFGSACKAGPWTTNAEEDNRLKNKYWNLCAVCEGGDCGPSDKYRGSGGSLVCFKDGIGDVLWARHEDVKAHLKFLESDSTSDYDYLCEDGSLVPLESENPCIWLAKPWQVVGANRKSAIDVQKLVDVLSDGEHNDWEENLLHVIELYLEYIQNLLVSRTPEDYLRRIPGYLSASAMSQGNCKPRRSVKFCVTSAAEEEKCDWMSKAGSSVGIQPPLGCVQLDNLTACLDSVARKETDVVSVPPDFLYDALIKFNLKTFLLETGSEFEDNYFSCIVSKKNFSVKTLADLKGKRICLMRKHGIGWWSLLAALHRESLVGSPCDNPADHFEEVRLVSGPEGQSCGPKGTADDESQLLRCLREDKCDAAILDLRVLKDDSDESKDLRRTDFGTIAGISDGQCMWSHPHYLMTSEASSTPRGQELFSMFFQMGQSFGRDSQKSNPMLRIFGPFHETKNVLFKDSSSAFTASSPWNRSNSFVDALERIKVCSKSPAQPTFPSVAAVVFFVMFFTGAMNFGFLSKLS